MTLLNPSFLWLLLPLVLLLWSNSRKLATFVHLIILMIIVLTLSRPVQEQALQKASIEAKDIIIALDVSYSMKATDISPTRYDFAKETISALLQQNPADNIMLIAFTTNPLLLSPPTTDHALINVALQNLNPEFILTKGTSLEKLFKKLASMKMGHKNLILMTDGGEEDNLAQLTTLVQNANISLTVLALGTTRGSTVKNKDGSLLKDKEGNLVISRVNPLLAALTSSVSGSYFTVSSTAQATADNLNDALQKNESKVQSVEKMQRHYMELYQIPLSLALLLFFMVHTRAVKYLFILFTFLGLQAEAAMLDNYHLDLAYKNYKKADFNETKTQLKQIEIRSLQSQMALANTYYKQSEFKKAIQVYKSIRSTSSHIKQQLYYNIANAYGMLESYDKAKIYYTKALQLKRVHLLVSPILNHKILLPVKVSHRSKMKKSHKVKMNQVPEVAGAERVRHKKNRKQANS
ncbi:VWA domain-containing protein [Campylobacterota bacterium]